MDDIFCNDIMEETNEQLWYDGNNYS
jgi:hypothetical protein